MLTKDQVFAVSGGASGLGAAVTRRLIADGGRVIVLDRDEANGQALTDELGEAADFQACDVGDETSLSAALDGGIERLGPLRGAIACAGIAPAARILGRDGVHDASVFALTMEINALGTFNLLRLAAERMQSLNPLAEGERGVIVLTASIAAWEGQIGQLAYAASKGAVVSMVLPAARELARLGIRCLGIAPGLFDTPMMGGLTPAAHSALESSVPFPARLGRAAEFADLVAHAIRNPMLNGTTLRLDGALRMPPR